MQPYNVADAQQKQKSSELDMHMKKIDAAMNLARMAPDTGSWLPIKQQGAMMGLDMSQVPNSAEEAPPGYKEKIMNDLLSAKDQLGKFQFMTASQVNPMTGASETSVMSGNTRTGQLQSSGLGAGSSIQSMSGNKGPMAPQEWEFYQALPADQQARYLEMKRSNKVMDLGGSQAVIGPGGQITQSYPKTLPPQDVPEVKGQQERAVQTEKNAANLAAKRPHAENALMAAADQQPIMNNAIDKALQQANSWTTGLAGNLLKDLPQTQAHDLQQTIESVKSNVGLDRLQEMRNNSPTGGALGPVSDFENKLLQKTIASLEQSQTLPQFKQNLEAVRRQYKLSWEHINTAFQRDFGTPYNQQNVTNPQPQSPNGSVVPSGVDPRLWEHLTPEERKLFQ